MRRNIKIFVILLLIVNLIGVFTPYFYIRETWQYDPDSMFYHGTASLISERECSFFKLIPPISRVLSYVVAILWILCMITIFFSILFSMENKLIYYFPTVCLVAFTVCTRYTTVWAKDDTASYRFEWSPNWMFYVSLALQIIAAVMMFIAMTSKNISFSQVTVHEKTSADKLLESKELLDCGIITQEEFDEIKENLLGNKP